MKRSRPEVSDRHKRRLISQEVKLVTQQINLSRAQEASTSQVSDTTKHGDPIIPEVTMKVKVYIVT